MLTLGEYFPTTTILIVGFCHCSPHFFSALPTRWLVTCEERYSDLEKSIYLPSPSNGGFSKPTRKYEKQYDVQSTDEFVRLHPCAQLVTKQVCLTPIALVYRFSLLTWESLKKILWNPQPHKNNLSDIIDALKPFQIQGSYRSWKTWKVIKFNNFISQAGKVIEFNCWSCKVLEILRKIGGHLKLFWTALVQKFPKTRKVLTIF